jgi:uncharacterized protein
VIRVVLDTNIVVAALLQPLGPPAHLFALVVEGVLQACLSREIYAEYEEVIGRPKFRRDTSTKASTLLVFREKGFWVKPTEPVRACSDPDDDIFLECAQAARAQYLVTGNLKHFPKSWFDVQVVTPRQLLDGLPY